MDSLFHRSVQIFILNWEETIFIIYKVFITQQPDSDRMFSLCSLWCLLCTYQYLLTLNSSFVFHSWRLIKSSWRLIKYDKKWPILSHLICFECKIFFESNQRFFPISKVSKDIFKIYKYTKWIFFLLIFIFLIYSYNNKNAMSFSYKD